MGRRTTRTLGALGLVAAAWSGAWFWGKSEIRGQLDEQISVLAKQGVAASYQGVEIGGFPFAYRGRVVEPRYQAPIVLAQGVGRSDWSAEWVGFDASLSDFGAVNFVLPDQQSLTIVPPSGVAAVNIAIQSTRFEGRLAQKGGTDAGGKRRGIARS